MRNSFEVRGDIVAIFLAKKDGTLKAETIVDLEGFEEIKKLDYRWHAKKCPSTGELYAFANMRRSRKYKNAGMSLARVIANTPFRFLVDHINRNTLDNRKINLRNVNAVQNRLNNNSCDVTESEFGRWRARISFRKKSIALGTYLTESEARIAYFAARLVADAIESIAQGTQSIAVIEEAQ